jgi:chitodextrinase
MSNLMKFLLKTLFPFVLLSLFGCGGGGGGSGNDVVVDTTPPPVPTGLTATVISASQINLSWNAATDAAGYKVYRNGTFTYDRFGATTLQDISLTANSTYTYKVSAYDSSGNESAQSNPASAKTLGTATVLMGTAVNEFGRGAALDNSGNLYVTGWTCGYLDGLSNPGGADVFLVKYNPSGVKQWTRLLGTTGVVDPNAGMDLGSYGLNVAVDSPRNAVYVTGYTTGAMDGQAWTGGRDLFLVRYDLNGNNRLTKLYGGATLDEVGNAVAVDLNGYVYVAGYLGGAASGKDILLLKYNASLDLQAYRVVGSSSDDAATGVAIDATGYAIYLTGIAGGILPLGTGTSPAYAGKGDLFIAKFNGVPEIQWSTLLGSSEMDAGLAIAVSGSTVSVAGMTAGSLPGKTSAGGTDIVVASYTASGAVIWIEQRGTSADEVAYGIAVDNDPGNIFITGFTGGSPSPFKPNAGLEDLFLMKFGVGGGTPFAISLAGTTMGDEGRAIVLRETDHVVYVVGHTEGNLDAVANSGGYDMCLLKFNLAGEQQ